MEIAVPLDWELGAHRGEQRAGDVTLDDGARVRLHLRWMKSSRSRSPLPRLIARLRKSHHRQWGRGAAFQQLRADTPGPGIETAHYSRESTPKADGLVWWRRDRGRAGIVEVFDASIALTSHILGSFRDKHYGELRHWSVYGLSFTVPPAYTKCQPTFSAGHLYFRLSASTSDWISVERWAMASHCLRRLPLDRWPLELLAHADPAHARITAQAPITHDGCQGIRFENLPLRSRLKNLWRPSPETEGLVWHVAETDKLLAIVANGGARSALGSVAASMRSS